MPVKHKQPIPPLFFNFLLTFKFVSFAPMVALSFSQEAVYFADTDVQLYFADTDVWLYFADTGVRLQDCRCETYQSEVSRLTNTVSVVHKV